ncbi:D-glycero-beta-D-manno-heptose-7-phosphate kinase [Venenivibrio stagnispumantis]|uniref:RfaE bifunctional protein, domain I n=1 Tax=Venenivibrio stagnispumantis TaxID=407998 RepID=A0AA45WMX6_9AQUI|nr:D-glycero-beta-D-manno-heptose-7-phosphate kinase [Venenivibrio stagnispumantis]MCW4573709.1 D-glycero-beta-D-manno-heptose-7-phosphate kinase [Venenivibrio stagnispumantis]SMP16057.1 rfaE bifunctional protein, domain I [Venenivibrio stagnispumantis]
MIQKERALEIISNLKKAKILVIGDIILDKYLWGNVERISPEAPVPVVEVIKENYNLGGASNVANNIASLNAEAILIGVVGKDENAKILKNLLEEKNIKYALVEDKERPTIEKTRIIAVSQQLLRIDRENKAKLSKEIEEEIIKNIKNVLDKVDSIIVSDYGKGVITQNIMDLLVSSGKMIFVDPKPSNFMLYKNTTILTPNRKEAYELVKADKEESLENVAKKIMENLNLQRVLITLSSEGMALFEKDKVIKIPAKAKKVYDVTGAGDTVISVLSMAKSIGASWEESAIIANYAAGYVVGEIGTATVTEDILTSLFS